MSKLKVKVKYILDSRIAGSTTSELYFISDREIKAGDLCFNSFDNRIWEYQPAPCPLPYWGNKDNLKKLEATTNKELSLLGMRIPLIPQSFVEKFAESQYSITEVNLELIEATRHESLDNYDDDVIYLEGHIIKTIDKDEKFDLNRYTQVKVRANGTVIVSRVKNNYTLEEVQKLCSQAHNLGRQDVLASQQQGKFVDSFNEWFIEQI